MRIRKQLSKEQILLSIPVKNACIRWTKNENGETVLRIPRKKGRAIYLLSKVFFVPEEKTVILDKVGSHLWELCNGKNSVNEIIKSLQKTFEFNQKKLEPSCLEYLKKMVKRGIIGLAICNEE